MFEFAELAHAVTKIAYRREEPKLRAKLLDAQYDYEAAVWDMVDRTSTRVAPWTRWKRTTSTTRASRC